MNIKLILKGFVVGIGKIIPGVSGALIAISLGLYDTLIGAVTNFFSNKKENLKFLLNLGIGALLGIVLFSKIIIFLLDKYNLYTMIFFIGLIIGGTLPLTKTIKKNKKNIILVIISLIVIIFLSISNTNNSYILKNNFLDILNFMYGGFLEAIGTIVPGVSATALLMLSGLYNIMMEAIGDVNLRILIPFMLSFIISVILLLKLTNYCIKKYYQTSYSLIIGISFGTIVVILLKIINQINISNLISSIIFLILGLIISKKFEK